MKNTKEKIKIVVADRKKILLDRWNWLIGQETLSAGKLRRKSIEWQRKQGKITQNQRKFYLLTSFTPPAWLILKLVIDLQRKISVKLFLSYITN